MYENLKRASGFVIVGVALWAGLTTGSVSDLQWALNVLLQLNGGS